MGRKSKAEGLGRGAALAFPLGWAGPPEAFPILRKARQGWTQSSLLPGSVPAFFWPRRIGPHLPGARLSLGPRSPTHLH